MNRRDFLLTTSRAAMTAPFLKLPDFMKSAKMGVVVHSYASRWNSKTDSQRYPGFKDAIDLMEHCKEIGAGGVQVSVRDWTSDFSKNVRSAREKLGLYLEGSIALPKQGDDVSRFEKDIAAAKEAGATVVRTVCLSGRRYENFQSLPAFQEFKRKAQESLALAEPVVRKYKIRLAIENHKDWRSPELAAIMEELSSEWVGVTVDFGNNVALIEDPMEVVKTLAPWAFSTHVKDMGVQEYAEGFLLSEVPLGEGVLDLQQMVEVCRKHHPEVTFNLEMITRDPLRIPCLTNEFWSTFTDVTPSELAAALKLVREKPFRNSLPEVSQLSDEQRLAAEETNVVTSLEYSRSRLAMN